MASDVMVATNRLQRASQSGRWPAKWLDQDAGEALDEPNWRDGA